MAATDPLSLVFSALADPTRRAILERLSDGEATVGELAEPFPISLPAISRHLKVLEQAGLIVRGQQAQWRTSALRAEPLQDATGWMEALTRVWGERFDRLDAHLEFMKRQLGTAPADGDTQPAGDAADAAARGETRSPGPGHDRDHGHGNDRDRDRDRDQSSSTTNPIPEEDPSDV